MSEAATFLTKSMSASLRKVALSELFSLLKRTVEHEVSAVIICVYNIDSIGGGMEKC
jgi:hypothetical protein